MNKPCATAFILFSLWAMTATGAEEKREIIQLKLVDANSDATARRPADTPLQSYFFRDSEPVGDADAPAARAWYQGIYPGIELACFGDNRRLEYIFRLRQGADPSLIRIQLSGPLSMKLGHSGEINHFLREGEIIQSAPVAFRHADGSTAPIPAEYVVLERNVIGIRLPRGPTEEKIGPFNFVPGDQNSGGPRYDYYMSRFETTQDQFLRFLNDAEANPKGPRGENMFFDAAGNVWIHPERKPGRDELFTVSQSRLTYTRDKPAGSRFEHRRLPDQEAPYKNHPVAGVSWYGALKFCNWLTLEAGRGQAEQCYTEGTQAMQWAPVTATNWANGKFEEEERALWLSKKGFRLPMVNSPTPQLVTNAFNEFLKAGTWHGFTNRLYGFGRDLAEVDDANFVEARPLTAGTTPVGFFSGETRLGKRLTRPSRNYYGLHDISGNVSEWSTDLARPGSLLERILCGGSHSESPKPVFLAVPMAPHKTGPWGGLRPSTLYMPSETQEIHILFRFFLETSAPTSRIPTLAVIPGGTPTDETLPALPGFETGQPDRIVGDEFSPRIIRIEEEEEKEEDKKEEEKDFPDGGVSPGSGRGPGPGPGPFPPVITFWTLTTRAVTNNQAINISINVSSNGVLTPSGITQFSRTYTNGTFVSLTAPPDSGTGEAFIHWLINGMFYSANPSISVTLTANRVATAVYGPATLRVRSSAPNSGVVITNSLPDLNGNSHGTTAFDRYYVFGSAVILTAPFAAGGNQFSLWLLDGVPQTTNRVTPPILMNTSHTLTAVYRFVPGPIPDPPISPGGI